MDQRKVAATTTPVAINLKDLFQNKRFVVIVGDAECYVANNRGQVEESTPVVFEADQTAVSSTGLSGSTYTLAATTNFYVNQKIKITDSSDVLIGYFIVTDVTSTTVTVERSEHLTVDSYTLASGDKLILLQDDDCNAGGVLIDTSVTKTIALKATSTSNVTLIAAGLNDLSAAISLAASISAGGAAASGGVPIEENISVSGTISALTEVVRVQGSLSYGALFYVGCTSGTSIDVEIWGTIVDEAVNITDKFKGSSVTSVTILNSDSETFPLDPGVNTLANLTDLFIKITPSSTEGYKVTGVISKRA